MSYIYLCMTRVDHTLTENKKKKKINTTGNRKFFLFYSRRYFVQPYKFS